MARPPDCTAKDQSWRPQVVTFLAVSASVVIDRQRPLNVFTQQAAVCAQLAPFVSWLGRLDLARDVPARRSYRSHRLEHSAEGCTC